MSVGEFVAYVGPPELHDAVVRAVERDGDRLRVRVESDGGRPITLEFTGVGAVVAHRAEGMVLYALAEFAAAPPFRRFEFAPWEEGADARLAVEAAAFVVRDAGTPPRAAV